MLGFRKIYGGARDIGHDLAGKGAPRLKFNFTCQITFRTGTGVVGSLGMETLDIPLKTATRPRVAVQNQDVNFNNYRAKVSTKVEFGAVNIIMYDDMNNTALKIYEAYIKELSGIYGKDSPDNYKSGLEYSSIKRTGLSFRNGIIREIKVRHYNTSNNPGSVTYTYFNPRVSNMELDELDMGSSDPTMVNMTFTYDSFNIEYD